MSRLAAVSILAILATMPASAEEPVALRDMGSFHSGMVEISGKPDKQITFMSDVRFRIDPSEGNEAGQLPQAEDSPPSRVQSNLIGVTADGRQVFCFCGRTSF
jgi:hypothetical protein